MKKTIEQLLIDYAKARRELKKLKQIWINDCTDRADMSDSPFLPDSYSCIERFRNRHGRFPPRTTLSMCDNCNKLTTHRNRLWSQRQTIASYKGAITKRAQELLKGSEQ